MIHVGTTPVRNSLIALATLSISLVAAGLSTEPPIGSDADQQAIREIVQKYLDSREQGEAQAVEALFTKDADQLVSTGEWRRGRDALVRGALASSQRASGKRTITVESIRFVTADVALVDGRYEITGTSGADSRRMWSTFLFTRGPKSWQIAAIRNMLPAPPNR